MSAAPLDELVVTDATTGAVEEIRYVDVGGGEQLYTVHHRAAPADAGRPLASIVLATSIGASRERGHRSIVDLARALAAAGHDVLRFDYRGIGESGGAFEAHGFTSWRCDLERAIELLRDRAGASPLGVWGVRGGALLASEVFAAGLAGGAMLCAPMDGQALLQDILRRTLVADMMARPHAKRTPREEIIAGFERGESSIVDGYRWTRLLWTDAADHRIAFPSEPQPTWRVVDFKGLPKTALPPALERCREIETGERFWESTPRLIPRTRSLADKTLAWARSLTEGSR